MARRRFLPRYVTSFVDRHGKERLRFRRKGYTAHYFAAALGTEAFRVEYAACMAGPADPVAAAIERTAPGTIADLVTRYFATPSRLGPSATTQAKVRRIIADFREEHGHRQVSTVRFEHIDAIVAKKAVPGLRDTARGPRAVGGVEAARKLRKELIRLFEFAVKLRMRPDNPVRQSEKVKVPAGERSTGFHTWSEDDIATFRAHHAPGTRPRLAMELMLWTGQRGGDVIRMGRQHVADGRIRVRQAKGGKELTIALAPQLLAAIVAMPPRQGALCFLLTEWGRPFSAKGFSGWFSEQCTLAGLPACTAHGLRKAAMRRMAELGLSQQTLKSISGHSGDDEVALYTREADQQRLAESAIRALAAWEMSNLAPELDTASS